jgi:hypothetical protein
MTGLGDEESCEVLAEHRLGRTGLRVKLDKGFAQGVYCVYVEYEERADRIGFTAAREQALDYCSRLRVQLAGTEGYRFGGTEDASGSGDPRRRRDLECTFLSFAVTSNDGRWHDVAMKERFRVALLRADQAWDQVQARQDARRRDGRRETFRRRLDALLAGDAYAHLDAATKERLLVEVTALAFPPKGRGLE